MTNRKTGSSKPSSKVWPGAVSASWNVPAAPPWTDTSFSTSIVGHATVVVAVADRSRASDWVVVVEAVAVLDRLAQPVTVPVTVMVTEAPAASEPRAHGNVSL